MQRIEDSNQTNRKGTETERGTLELEIHKGGAVSGRFDEGLSIPYLTLTENGSRETLFDFREPYQELQIKEISRLSLCDDLSVGAALINTKDDNSLIIFSTEDMGYKAVRDISLDDFLWTNCKELYFLSNGELNRLHFDKKRVAISHLTSLKVTNLATTRLTSARDKRYLIIENLREMSSTWSIFDIASETLHSIPSKSILDITNTGGAFFVLREITNGTRFVEKHLSLNELAAGNKPSSLLTPNKNEHFESLESLKEKLLIKVLSEGQFHYILITEEDFPTAISKIQNKNCSYDLVKSLDKDSNTSFRCHSYSQPVTKVTLPKNNVGVTLLPPFKNSEFQYPILLTAYGAYGETLTPRFNPLFELLRQRGVGVAIAHIRGGGYHGKRWHLDGRGENKSNGIQDLIKVAKYLKDRYRDVIYGYGKSAGAFPFIGAHGTSPNLFSKLIFEFPIVDPLTQITESDRYFVREREEWGDFSSAPIHEMYQSYRMAFNRTQTPLTIYLRLSTADKLVPFKPLIDWSDNLAESNPKIRQIVDISNTASHRGELEGNEELKALSRIAEFISE